MNSRVSVLIVGWSVLCALSASLAFPEVRAGFSEQQTYFVWLRDPSKLTGSEDDTRARRAIEEMARRGILKDHFLETLRKDESLGAQYVEYLKVPSSFYWCYLFALVLFWGIPALLITMLLNKRERPTS